MKSHVIPIKISNYSEAWMCTVANVCYQNNVCVKYEIWIPHPGSHEVKVKEHFHFLFCFVLIAVECNYSFQWFIKLQL